MKIEKIQIKNFKVFKDVTIEKIPPMAVFIGKNGSGKSTLFDIFGFMHDCLEGNVKTALAKRGGFKEVRSRDQDGPISIEIKFRTGKDEPLVTYSIEIDLNTTNDPIVKKEILQYKRGTRGKPWKMLDFSDGKGKAIEGDPINKEEVKKANREEQTLESPDILAIKGLGQFKKFKAVSKFRRFIEDWHVSDLHIDAARSVNEFKYSEHLNPKGENLSSVAQYIYENHKDIFDQILVKMSKRVPGVKHVEAKTTEDGGILLKFQDGKFKNPFAARFVSDGTIKMFAYLILLNDPKPHNLLCIEEPENQLYPKLLGELAEEFREYAESGGQVFVSTHSPDLLNSIQLNEIYYLIKNEGFTSIKRAEDAIQLKELCDAGDKPGYLWNQDLFEQIL